MGLNYRDIQIAIRNILISDTALQALLGVSSTEVVNRVKVGHMANINVMSYPCITFNLENGGVDFNQFSASSDLKINIWSKDNIDSAQLIYGRIKALLNLVPITGGGIARLLERRYNDSLYEVETRTHHIAVLYEIISINY